MSNPIQELVALLTDCAPVEQVIAKLNAVVELPDLDVGKIIADYQAQEAAAKDATVPDGDSWEAF